ncbi:MAG: hypothetical protein LH465_05470 [Sphingomonas bacterium]|nr:hypothetical protein [Sphingomonas bacterium]
MATTKSTTPRRRTAKPRTTTRAKADTSIVARTGRTIKASPYTSAAIATGAVTAVAAAAAGAFFFSRRDKSFKQASEELTNRVKDGFASASGTVKDGFAGASDKIKDLAERGTDYLKGDSDSGKVLSQAELAEEALTLKQTGQSTATVDKLASDQAKVGSVAY